MILLGKARTAVDSLELARQDGAEREDELLQLLVENLAPEDGGNHANYVGNANFVPGDRASPPRREGYAAATRRTRASSARGGATSSRRSAIELVEPSQAAVGVGWRWPLKDGAADDVGAMGGGGGKAGARARARMCSCQLVRWGLGRRICMRPSSWRRLGRDHGMHAELEVMEGDGGGGRRARERRAANQGRVSSESGGWGRVNVVCAHVWCACGLPPMCACRRRSISGLAHVHLASQCSGVSRAPFSVTVAVFFGIVCSCVYMERKRFQRIFRTF